MLTFNASTINREELSKINDPFQILPGGRSSFQTKDVLTFKEMKNENIILHSSYITRPFNLDISNITKINLRNYVKLANRLGTKDILIHMPSNVSEYEAYGFGVSAIVEMIIKNNCKCHLETNPLSKELQKYLGITKTNAVEKYFEYTELLLKTIPDKYKSSFNICVDTAHLFANGFDTKNMITYIKKYLDRIKYIHFNGNKNSMFTKDNHVPMYRSDNKIDNVKELTSYCASTKKILIAEDSTEKGTYEEWKKFCEEYKIPIVKFNEIYSI